MYKVPNPYQTLNFLYNKRISYMDENTKTTAFLNSNIEFIFTWTSVILPAGGVGSSYLFILKQESVQGLCLSMQTKYFLVAINGY